ELGAAAPPAARNRARSDERNGDTNPIACEFPLLMSEINQEGLRSGHAGESAIGRQGCASAENNPRASARLGQARGRRRRRPTRTPATSASARTAEGEARRPAARQPQPRPPPYPGAPPPEAPASERLPSGRASTAASAAASAPMPPSGPGATHS